MDLQNSLHNENSLIPILMKLSKEISGLISERLKKANIDLTKSQAIVLSKLVSRDHCAQQDLALITARDKTSLTRLLMTMERKGLINRVQSKQDRRIKEVSITEFGKQQFHLARPIIHQLSKQSHIGLSDEEILATKNIFLKIYNNLNLEYEQ